MNKLIPAIIQDYKTGRVLMLGYMNKIAYQTTLKTKRVTFWSRSRNKLWVKGETSSNYLLLKKILFDCDKDAILCLVEPVGPTCHTETISCFSSPLEQLEAALKNRKKTLPKDSYSASLFKRGISAITAKITEEAAEVVKAATSETKQRLIEEIADLWFHSLLLGIYKNISLEEIETELKTRQK